MTALRAFITIGLAVFWLALFAPPMFQTPPAVYTGVTLERTGELIQRNLVRVDRGSPAYRAGLRTGDVLGCLSSRDAALLFNSAQNIQAGYVPGTVISTCVSRNGATVNVHFTAQTRGVAENTYGSNALSALRVLVAIVFSLTGIALVIARPCLMTWLFFVYCLGSAPSFASGEVWTILPPWAFAVASGLPSLGSLTAVSFLLLFSIVVPNDGIPSGWRRVAFVFACAIVAADLALMAASQWVTAFYVTPDLQNNVDEALTMLTVLFIAARLATMERSERARFGWAAFAIIFGVITNDLRNVLSTSDSHGVQALSVLAADLTVIMPLAMTYAILKRHVIDVRFVISRTVVYAIITTLVIAVIGAVDWLTSAYLSQVRVAMAIDAGVTIALAFVLHRAYGQIERAVDFLLYRHKHRAQTYLNRLAKTFLRATREETIDRAVVQAPYEKLDLAMAALFRAEGSSFVVSAAVGWDLSAAPALDCEHELVRFLSTERQKLQVRDLRSHVAEQFESGGPCPALAIPIFQGDDLTAFAVYGIHRDGTKLDPDEIETLEHLSDSAAQAYVRIELLRYRTMLQSPLPA